MKKKKLIWLLLLFGIFLSFIQPVNAADSDFLEKLLPQIDGQGVEKKYTEHPISNYTLDTDSSWFEPTTGGIMLFLNMWMSIQATAVRIGILFLEQAYTLDLLGAIVGYIDKFIKAYRSSTWDLFITPLLVVSGIYILFNAAIAYKRSKSVEQLLTTLAVIAFATLLFAYPKQILTGFNDLSRDMSGAVLASTLPMMNNQAHTINQGVVVAGNQIWEQQVLYPWYLLQFKSIPEGKVKGEGFLQYPKGHDKREKLMEAEVKAGNTMMTSEGIFDRVIIIMMSHFLNLITLIILTVISILTLISQLVPLVLICISPIVVTVALIPRFGLGVIYKLTERVLGAIFYKVVLSIFLSIFIVATHVFAAIFGTYYIIQLIVQFLVVLTLILERKRIIGLFTSLPKGEGAFNKVLEEKSNYSGQIGSVVKPVVQGALAIGGLVASGGTSSFLMAAAAAGGRGGAMMSAAYMGKQVIDGAKRKSLMPHAEGLLHKRFLDQKSAADSYAEQTGTPPKYSPFVQEVMNRSEQGLPLYTEQQKANVVGELQDIEKQGGDINRVFNPTGIQTNNPVLYGEEVSKYQQRIMAKNLAFQENRGQRISAIEFMEQGGTAQDMAGNSTYSPPPLESFSQGINGEDGVSLNPNLDGQFGGDEAPQNANSIRIPVKRGSNPLQESQMPIDITHLPSGPRQGRDVSNTMFAQNERNTELHRLADRAIKNGDMEQFGQILAQIDAEQESAASVETPRMNVTLDPQEMDAPWMGNLDVHLPTPAAQVLDNHEEVVRGIESELSLLNQSPRDYVNTLDTQRSVIGDDLKALTKLKANHETGTAIAPDVQVRAEQVMANSGLSLNEAIKVTQQKHQGVEQKLDVASDLLNVAPVTRLEDYSQEEIVRFVDSVMAIDIPSTRGGIDVSQTGIAVPQEVGNLKMNVSQENNSPVSMNQEQSISIPAASIQDNRGDALRSMESTALSSPSTISLNTPGVVIESFSAGLQGSVDVVQAGQSETQGTANLKVNLTQEKSSGVLNQERSISIPAASINDNRSEVLQSMESAAAAMDRTSSISINPSDVAIERTNAGLQGTVDVVQAGQSETQGTANLKVNLTQEKSSGVSNQEKSISMPAASIQDNRNDVLQSIQNQVGSMNVSPITYGKSDLDQLHRQANQAMKNKDMEQLGRLIPQIERIEQTVSPMDTTVKVTLTPSATSTSSFSNREVNIPIAAAPVSNRHEVISTVESEVAALKHTPVQYVNQLDTQRKQLYGDMKALTMYQEAQQGGSIKIVPVIQERAAQVIQRDGGSLEGALSSVQQKYQSVSQKMEVATEHFGVGQKRYIEVPVQGQVQQVKIKTPSEYFDEIHTAPLSSLNFDIGNVDGAFRQSVLNEWTIKRDMGQEPSNYLQELFSQRQAQHKSMSIFQKAASTSKEYSQQAKRAQAAYVDATKRYDIAKELLGIDDGHSRTKYRKLDKE